MKETPIFEEVFSRMLGLPGFWVKVLIGGLLSFVPVVNIFAFGYLLRLSSRVRKTGQLVLPEWSDWSGLFKDGLRFAVVWLFYWLLPVLLAAAFASIIGFFGLGALAYLIFSVVFLLAPILFSSALYRYQMRSNLKDLIDVALIIRMTAGSLDRLIIPALVFAGIFAVAAPLYGFAVFFGFGVLVIYTSLSFRIIEQRQTVAF
jgi:predicted outer membrane lipoprotein